MPSGYLQHLYFPGFIDVQIMIIGSLYCNQ